MSPSAPKIDDGDDDTGGGEETIVVVVETDNRAIVLDRDRATIDEVD